MAQSQRMTDDTRTTAERQRDIAVEALQQIRDLVPDLPTRTGEIATRALDAISALDAPPQPDHAAMRAADEAGRRRNVEAPRVQELIGAATNYLKAAADYSGDLRAADAHLRAALAAFETEAA